MNLKKRQKGVVAVEAALLLPILLVLVFGIIEFGVALYDKAVITNAAREGARFGIVVATPPRQASDIQTVVNNYTSTYLLTFARGGATPLVTATGTGGSFGSSLAVTVTYTYTGLVLGPMLAAITGPITLTSTATMANE